MGTRKKLTPSDDGKPRHFIRQWRESKDMTIEELASAANLSVSSISQLERGKQGYSQSTLEQIALVFGCSPADLISHPPANDNDWRATINDAVSEAREAGVSRQAINDVFIDIMQRVRELEKSHPERLQEATEAAEQLTDQTHNH